MFCCHAGSGSVCNAARLAVAAGVSDDSQVSCAVESRAGFISVLMPVHNAGSWLQLAVDSVLRQSWRAFELLLIDDRSNDGAIETLPADPRVRILRAPRAGIVAALNRGLQHAVGDWIARMDADDVCSPERFAVQMEHARRNPRLDIVGARIALLDAPVEGGWSRYAQWSNGLTEPSDIFREMFVESPLVHPTLLMPTALLRRLGGYSEGDFPEDYELWLRAAAAGCRFGKPAQVLLHWRDHGQRLTRCDPRYAPARFLALKARHLASWRLAGRPVWIGGAGPGGRRLHDALGVHQVNVLGFVDVHPRRVGGLKRGLPVWSTTRLRRPMVEGFGLFAVGSPGARERVREEMAQTPLREGEDWIFVA